MSENPPVARTPARRSEGHHGTVGRQHRRAAGCADRLIHRDRLPKLPCPGAAATLRVRVPVSHHHPGLALADPSTP